MDSNNNPVRNYDCDIAFDVTGDCRILGSDNGSVGNVTRPIDLHCNTNAGKALLIIEAGNVKNTRTIKSHGVKKEDLISIPIKIDII